MEDTITAPAAETGAPTGGASPALGAEFMGSLDTLLASTEAGDGSDPAQANTDPVAGQDPAPDKAVTEAEIPQETWDAEIGGPTVVDGPNGKIHQYTPEQSLALHSNSRFTQELRAAIPDITVDDAIAHDQAYTDLSKLVHDMRRGTPDGVQRFASMIAKEAGQGPFAAGLAARLVDHVRQSNPAAYDSIKGGVEKEIEAELYGLAQKAANHPDKSIKDGYRQLAELFSFHTNGGNYKPVAEYAKFDPLADREAKVDAREQAVRDQEQQRVENQANAWRGSVKTEIDTQLAKEVDGALAPFAKKFEKAPGLLKMVQESVVKQIRDNIRANAEFRDRFQIKFDQGQQELSRNSAQSVIDFYLARARSILKQQAPKMISSASNGLIEANKSRHQQLERASSASHRVSGATGAPPQQSIMQSPGKFRSPADFAKEIDRLVQA